MPAEHAAIGERRGGGMGGRRHADGAASTLLAALPHEIRRSLGVIAILTDGGADAGSRRAIAEEVGRLDRLVDVVSEVARVLSGARAVAHGPIDPGVATRSALIAFANDPDRCAVAEELPDTLPLVHADADLVERILLNLLANASKHGAPPVALRARATRGHVDLTVVDGGSGIPRSVATGRSGLFAGTGGAGSMGVGLAISRLFAGEMGGRLIVTGSPGECRVTLRLRRTGR